MDVQPLHSDTHTKKAEGKRFSATSFGYVFSEDFHPLKCPPAPVRENMTT